MHPEAMPSVSPPAGRAPAPIVRGMRAGAREDRPTSKPGLRVVMDPVSQGWMDRLRESDPRHDSALLELHAFLLRAARRELRRQDRWTRSHPGHDHEDLAHHVAADALLAVTGKLEDYRGASRFTTWAYGFVQNKVLSARQRHLAKANATCIGDEALGQLPDRAGGQPHHLAQQREVTSTLCTAVARDLTDRQRLVFVAVALNDVPVKELARELGSTGNAVRKTLFDARRKLRASLDAAGYQVADAFLV